MSTSRCEGSTCRTVSGASLLGLSVLALIPLLCLVADVESTASVAEYYDLVSNIPSDASVGTAREQTAWKAHVHMRPPRDARGRLEGDLTEDSEKFFEIEDVFVNEIEKALVPLGPAYVQIWQRRSLEEGAQLKVETPKPKVKGLAVPK